MFVCFLKFLIKLQMAFSGFQSSSKLKSGLVEDETVFVRHLNFHLLLLVFHLFVAELMPCNVEENTVLQNGWLPCGSSARLVIFICFPTAAKEITCEI